MILDDIVARKRFDIRGKKAQLSVEDMLDELRISPLLFKNIRCPIITRRKVGNNRELKKASPSKGVIKADFDPIELARRMKMEV